MDVSVVICTHSAPPARLARVIDALARQTLGGSVWELLVVDNSSGIPVQLPDKIPPNARVIREERLGLTYARLCGIRATVAPLICFVDDDNVLAPDYLERALEVARGYPNIGIFNGSVKGEYEVSPSSRLRPYLYGLAVTAITEDSWSNDRFLGTSMPFGVGLCVRRDVALSYVREVEGNPLRRLLDRQGQLLLSGGDNDLAWTAIEHGYGVGRFHRLHVVHIIPRSRLTPQYLVGLHAGFEVSMEILRASRGLPSKVRGGSLRSFMRMVRSGPLGPWIWWRSCVMRRALRLAVKNIDNPTSTARGRSREREECS